MKTIALGMALTLFGAVGEARAQGSGYPSGAFDGFVHTLLVFDAAFGVVGLLTGVLSSESLAKREVNRQRFVASSIVGTFHLGLGAAGLWLAAENANGGNILNPAMAGIATAHLAIGLWNVVVPAIGFRQGAPGPTVAPMVFSGRGATGRRWSGVGVQGHW